MNTDDDARCQEIERRLKAAHGGPCECSDCRDKRFLLDLARTADAMLRTAFLDHGLDVDALLAEAERRAAKTAIEYIEQQNVMVVDLFGGYDRHGAFVSDVAAGLRRRFNLPPLEEPGR